jgi:hypothetical protein
VIWRVFDKIVEQRAGIADQGSGVIAGHRTARLRPPAPITSG